MAETTGLKQKVSTLISNLRYYWNDPPKGRYMTFKEIAAYAGGGIGAYFIVTLGTACVITTSNTLVSSTLGIDATDIYILYVIATLANIPLTGIRANIIDNTRNKGGKYRPYIVRMAIPTAIISVLMVWFPYDIFSVIFGTGEFLTTGKSSDYVAKCALILIFNFLLDFFYWFFYDAYENLIHVLSPNSQERADVASIKSVVYSFAPTLVNLVTPIIAGQIFHTNATDIRVYKLLYPIIAVVGILLCIVVYNNTSEKIVQARTHVIQIKFIDALKAVAKNKYFWIISMATWIGFLESAYSNILYWLYNYGGKCSGVEFGIIQTVYGNASLWGMILAPFCIRKWGKKSVLVVTNIFNIIFILLMYPFIDSIWLILGCLYMNAFMGSFMHILNPSIQADIRDYQQYRTGERIDGMFAAVTTIGNLITLFTSGVLPFIYERGGITLENAKAVTSDPTILSRMLGDGKTVGTILAEQAAAGQPINSYSALYDPSILSHLLHVLIIVSAIGAFMNVVPYFWYDFNERKQKSVIRVLQVRAMFEDYGNNALDDHQIVEAIDLVNNARKMAVATPKEVSKDMYKSIKDKEERKAAKKEYVAALEYNEDIQISKFVCQELDKFNTPFYKYQIQAYSAVYEKGLEGIKNDSMEQIREELKRAKKMPCRTEEEKSIRKFDIEIAKKKISAKKSFNKYYGTAKPFVEPEMADVTALFDREDELNETIMEMYKEKDIARKEKDSEKVRDYTAKIKELTEERKKVRAASKSLMDEFAHFNRSAKPYIDARKMLVQEENYKHLDEIFALYDEAKERAEEEDRIKAAEIEKRRAEEQADLERRKAARKLKK